MRRHLLLALGLTVAPSAWAQSTAASLAPGRIDIGTVVTDVTVSAASGPVTVSTNKAPATVVVFVSSRCPVSNAYNARMDAVYQDYSGKSVQFVFASANVTETLDELQKFQQSAKVHFPIYKDENNVLADRFGAHVTPEVFVFDQKGVLRYRGNIDDSQQESEITTRSLRTALDAVLGGKTVDVAITSPFGCSIKRKRAS